MKKDVDEKKEPVTCRLLARGQPRCGGSILIVVLSMLFMLAVVLVLNILALTRVASLKDFLDLLSSQGAVEDLDFVDKTDELILPIRIDADSELIATRWDRASQCETAIQYPIDVDFHLFTVIRARHMRKGVDRQRVGAEEVYWADNQS